MIDITPCALPSVVGSAITLAFFTVGVVDTLVREMPLLVAKTRIAGFASRVTITALDVLKSDPAYTRTYSAVYVFFVGASLVTVLYFCEIFIVMYLNLPKEKSGALPGIVKMYPLLRALITTTVVLEAIFILVYPVNLTQAVSTAVLVCWRILCVLPTFTVMTKLALKLRQHRLACQRGSVGRKRADTKKIEYHMLLLSLIALVVLMTSIVSHTGSIIAYAQTPNAEYVRFCNASNLALMLDLIDNLAFLVGLFLIRASRAKWRKWARKAIGLAAPALESATTDKSGDSKASNTSCKSESALQSAASCKPAYTTHYVLERAITAPTSCKPLHITHYASERVPRTSSSYKSLYGAQFSPSVQPASHFVHCRAPELSLQIK